MRKDSQIISLVRSKSLDSLDMKIDGNYTNFCDYYKNSRPESTSKNSENNWTEGNINGVCNDQVFTSLEQKIDSLSDLFAEQCRLMSEIKRDFVNNKPAIEKNDFIQNKLINELLKKLISQRVKELQDCETGSEMKTDVKDLDSRARSLLNAIEAKQAFCLDRAIRDAIVDFLQSDELREDVVAATVNSVKDIVQTHFTQDVSNLYIPVLEHWHRRLAKHITRVLEAAFIKLEESSGSFTNSIYNTSRSLRRALQRHQSLLEETPAPEMPDSKLPCVVQEMLQEELKQWRQDALEAICAPPAEIIPEWLELDSPGIDCSPGSPPQPIGPGRSIVDQLMKSAEINKRIRDGDVNGSFSTALSAGDLALVMGACRAVDPAVVFAPCRLTQPVILSLVQQLATDMLHETLLKCRYLEEALISLNTSHSATRMHLPLVIGEVRQHLTKFLAKYPNHVAHRRVTLIVMAADKLLK